MDTDVPPASKRSDREIPRIFELITWQLRINKCINHKKRKAKNVCKKKWETGVITDHLTDHTNGVERMLSIQYQYCDP